MNQTIKKGDLVQILNNESIWDHYVGKVKKIDFNNSTILLKILLNQVQTNFNDEASLIQNTKSILEIFPLSDIRLIFTDTSISESEEKVKNRDIKNELFLKKYIDKTYKFKGLSEEFISNNNFLAKYLELDLYENLEGEFCKIVECSDIANSKNYFDKFNKSLWNIEFKQSKHKIKNIPGDCLYMQEDY